MPLFTLHGRDYTKVIAPHFSPAIPKTLPCRCVGGGGGRRGHVVTNDWCITAHISVLPSVKENHLCITNSFDFPEDECLTVCKNIYKISFQEKIFTCRTTALSNTTQCKMTNSASVFCTELHSNTAAVKEIWQKLNIMHFNSYKPGIPFVGHRQTV